MCAISNLCFCQGVDYAYTIQGWLKSINGYTLAASPGAKDMGGDGTGMATAKDAYSQTLHYFPGDYKAIGGATPQTPSTLATNTPGTASGRDSLHLFIGEIYNYRVD